MQLMLPIARTNTTQATKMINQLNIAVIVLLVATVVMTMKIVINLRFRMVCN